MMLKTSVYGCLFFQSFQLVSTRGKVFRGVPVMGPVTAFLKICDHRLPV